MINPDLITLDLNNIYVLILYLYIIYRPLSADMLLYARMDTHYLLYVYDRLKNEAIQKSPSTLSYANHPNNNNNNNNNNPNDNDPSRDDNNGGKKLNKKSKKILSEYVEDDTEVPRLLGLILSRSRSVSLRKYRYIYTYIYISIYK